MKIIDGSHGEGGGQIIRSSLALSMVTGIPVTIENVRAGRKKPGLLRQHLTALRAAAEISSADVDGDELGSTRIRFTPHEISPGDYRFAIGTAGSAMLVLQTVLPPLMLADGPSNITIEGGTHNPYAPPFDFLEKTFLPLLRKMGPVVSPQLKQYGFYPAGGGNATFSIQPAQHLKPLKLLDRGKITERRVRAILSNLPAHIGKRECGTVIRKMNWNENCAHIEEIPNPRGPGNVLVIELHADHLTETFTAFGEAGVKAEHVANSVIKEIRRYVKSEVPVGVHLADQLLLPLGIGAAHGTGGGSFRTMHLSKHCTTNMDTMREFLDISIDVTPRDDGSNVITVSK